MALEVKLKGNMSNSLAPTNVKEREFGFMVRKVL